MLLTYARAMAAARDAADRPMRAGGRSRWSADDYNAMVRTFDRLMPRRCECCGEPAGEGGALCPACQEAR